MFQIRDPCHFMERNRYYVKSYNKSSTAFFLLKRQPNCHLVFFAKEPLFNGKKSGFSHGSCTVERGRGTALLRLIMIMMIMMIMIMMVILMTMIINIIMMIMMIMVILMIVMLAFSFSSPKSS